MPVGNILIKIGADAGQAVRELSTVEKSMGSTMSTSEKMGAGVKKAALPAAAALGAIAIAGVAAAKAAAEDAAAQEHLEGVLKRATGATEAQLAATTDWIDKTALATGVADDELRPAMEKLAVATKDTAKAQKLSAAALDIAAASGKDLDTVSAAIAKGYTGQTAALSKLVPGLSQAAKESKDFDTIMAELGKTTGGAAAESAGTAAGQYKILTLQMAELQEELGAALLPVIEALLPLLRAAASFAAENTTAIKILVIAVAALAGGILIANAAMKAYTLATQIWTGVQKAATAAQWLWNAAMSANPIGIVIIALAALGVALYVLWTKSETFRDIVKGALKAVQGVVEDVKEAFDKVLTAATTAFNWVKDHWKLALFAFGPIGAAVYLVVTNLDKVRAAVDAITDAIKTLVEWVKSVVDWLGKIKIPKLPGGINLPGPFAVTGTGPGAARTGSATATAAGAGGVTVNVYGALDPEGTARAIRRVLAQHDRRQGRIV